MKSKIKGLGKLSESSRRTLKRILEDVSEDEWNEDLNSLKVLVNRIEGIELTTAEVMECFLELVLWVAKVRNRRKGIWDDENEGSFLSYEEML